MTTAAHAQTLPTRPVTMIVPYAAGGPVDTVGRIMALAPTGPSPERCAVTLKVGTSSITSAGGSGTISVTTARECAWTVKAEADWLTFSAPTTGQGPADLAFSVPPNRSTSPRSVGVSVGDQRATISQEAATCPWNVSPSEVVMGAAGGDRTVRLSTEDFCSWVVTSRESWVAVASASNGKGNADIILRIAANDGPERTANVEVPGGTVTVRQREGTPPPVVRPSGCHTAAGRSPATAATDTGTAGTDTATGPRRHRQCLARSRRRRRRSTTCCSPGARCRWT